jgi:hypothetical protein
MRSVPNHSALRTWIELHGISQTKAAGIVGVEGRTFRRYTAPPEQPGHRDLPWSAWTLLRLYAGEITVEEFRAEVDAA